MSKAYKCDRCGVLTETASTHLVLPRRTCVEDGVIHAQIKFRVYEENYVTSDDVDLCPDCQIKALEKTLDLIRLYYRGE